MVFCAMNNYLYNPFMATNYFCNPFIGFMQFRPFSFFNSYNFNNRNNNSSFFDFNKVQKFSYVLPELNLKNSSIYRNSVARQALYTFDFKFSSNNERTSVNSRSVNSRLSAVGYSAEKGERLAREAKKGAVGFTGYCCRYTKRAIERADLGKAQAGHAYQYDTVLDNNPNFKRISTEGLDLDKDLPAGCVLVYERGVAGYNSKYGHIEITDGKGNAYSDGKTKNIRPGAKVYVPVESASYYA